MYCVKKKSTLTWQGSKREGGGQVSCRTEKRKRRGAVIFARFKRKANLRMHGGRERGGILPGRGKLLPMARGSNDEKKGGTQVFSGGGKWFAGEEGGKGEEERLLAFPQGERRRVSPRFNAGRPFQEKKKGILSLRRKMGGGEGGGGFS